MIEGPDGGVGSEEAIQAEEKAAKPARAVPPKVSNATLRTILNDEYEVGKTPSVGDGRATSALFEELKSGDESNGTFHYQDVVDLLGGLSNLLRDDRRAQMKTGTGLLSDSDRSIALEEAQRMWDAINQDDVTGKVMADYSQEAVANMRGTIQNVLKNPSLASVTESDFTEPTQFNGPRLTQAAEVSGAAKALGVTVEAVGFIPTLFTAYQIYQYGAASVGFAWTAGDPSSSLHQAFAWDVYDQAESQGNYTAACQAMPQNCA